MWLKFKLWLKNPAQNLWVLPTLGAFFSVAFSTFASVSHYVLPEKLVVDIAPDTLKSLLDIISGSMLAVTTFSLSIMVSALSATASSATPRARLLVISDSAARLAITSFISAFIYSVVAKIALGLKYYGDSGRFVMFVGTLLVLIYLVFTLIRWVQTLSSLGSLGDTLKKIEAVAKQGLAEFRRHPHLGINGTLPPTLRAWATAADATGYLVHLNLEELNQWAEKNQCHVHIAQRINSLVSKQTVLFELYPSPESPLINGDRWQEIDDELRNHALIETNKANYQDPFYGLIVLTEVGHRALSAAVNDPATAEQTMSLMTHLLIDTEKSDDETDNYKYLSIEAVDWQQATQMYLTLARDGIGSYDFVHNILIYLNLLHLNAPEAELRTAAKHTAAEIYDMAMQHIDYELDKERLQRLWQEKFV